MSAGPDLAQALAGYRGWRLGDDLVLRGHTVPEPWEPGVNEASCRFDRFGGGRPRRHRAPHPTCMCGLYALCDAADPQLHGTEAFGAIAAWGDVQVHRTGFRAQRACVTALCVPEYAGPRIRALLTAAAKRYGVRLVEHDRLEAEALRYGAPVSFDLLETSRSPRGPARPRPGLGREVEGHVWVRGDEHAVEVGLASGLPARLAPGDELVVARAGQDLHRDGELGAAVTGLGTLVLTAPVSGTVTEVNEELAGGPAAFAGRPEEDAWLVRMRPSRWRQEADSLVWGRAASLVYASFLSQEGQGVDVLADLRPELRTAHPPVRTFADVLQTLIDARRTAPYADAGAFTAHAVEPVRRRLAADAGLARHLARVDAVVELRLSDPDSVVVFDLRGERAEIRGAEVRAADRGAEGGGAGEPRAPDVALSMPARLAADCLDGREDLLAVVRRRQAQLTGSRPALAVAASALSELLAPSRAWGHRRPRGR